jgi:hypothetical protein
VPVKLPGCLSEVGIARDVIAIEHAPGLVSGDPHRHRLGDAIALVTILEVKSFFFKGVRESKRDLLKLRAGDCPSGSGLV